MKQIKDRKILCQLLESSGYAEQFSFQAVKDSKLFLAAPGEYIIEEGIKPTYLYYLCTGRTKLYLTHSNGKISLIDFFEPPCFIGEMELLSDEYEARAVQATCQSYLFALPVKAFRETLLNDARFLRNVCLLLGKKNQRNIVTASRNQAFPLSNRLAAFILLAQNKGIYSEKHTSAAEYLGVSYRHLLYVLADFAARGYIKKEDGGYQITDIGALVSLAREMEPEGGMGDVVIGKREYKRYQS